MYAHVAFCNGHQIKDYLLFVIHSGAIRAITRVTDARECKFSRHLCSIPLPHWIEIFMFAHTSSFVANNLSGEFANNNFARPLARVRYL